MGEGERRVESGVCERLTALRVGDWAQDQPRRLQGRQAQAQAQAQAVWHWQGICGRGDGDGDDVQQSDSQSVSQTPFPASSSQRRSQVGKEIQTHPPRTTTYGTPVRWWSWCIKTRLLTGRHTPGLVADTVRYRVQYGLKRHLTSVKPHVRPGG